ncbi:MAG: T9SS type A sorting domain-containing protein [bacterium]|nr:T9SS type A sorting domain-containing protein [bacterium]
MKKHLTVSLTLLALCLISPPSLPQNCEYSWSAQTSGTTRILYTCKAVNELVCWTAGANATVLRTTNGGVNWLNANPNPGIIAGDIRNMEAIDETTALVTTESQTSTAVYKTTDGGDSWFQVYSNNEGFIKGIRMIDSLNGIAVGSPISNIWNVLLTTDGGNTWQPSQNQPPANNIHQAVHNSFQVSMPNIYWGTSFTSIFRSTDGGLTYSEHETTGAGIYIFALFINSSGIGLAAATAMSRSTDGGVTFQSHSVPGAGNINGIESAGNNFWYIRGEKIFHSTDDGISWTDEYTATLTLTHMDFPDNLTGCQMGWAVGYGGTIHKMTSSGVTSVDSQDKLPEIYELAQNYPNPFNPCTVISYQMPVNGKVTLKVYDVLGNEIVVLVDEYKPAGSYEVNFDGTKLSSGVYIYKFETDLFIQTKKMILAK